MVSANPNAFRERFWAQIPPFPSGLRIQRLESIVVPQTGPGGAAVFDVASVESGSMRLPALVAYRQKVLPGEANGLARRLRSIEEQLRLRDLEPRPTRLPIIATETAGPGVMRLCEQEQLGLLDLRGTVLLQGPGLYIRVAGTHPARRQPRTPLFHGKGCRVVRTLLNAPAETRTVKAIAQAIQTSYAYTFDVIYLLEQEGFAFRRGPRSGVILRDPVGLLRAWIASGERTALAVDAFNARSTTSAALGAGFRQLGALGASSIFTLASAVPADSSFVTAVPHGIYSSASSRLIEEAFRLRRQTPHNFLVLRPEPAADTDRGGISESLRETGHGPAVSIPQLIVDLHGIGGRAKEQADALLATWSAALPILDMT